jgi:hypothetical protein
MPVSEPLIPVFVPPLANVLAFAEKQKGSPLTATEVAATRDKGVCIMMRPVEAARMDESRGFVDVNPENCWADWHRLRPQLVTGYLPKIILCIPGDETLRERCEPILRAQCSTWIRPPHPTLPPPQLDSSRPSHFTFSWNARSANSRRVIPSAWRAGRRATGARGNPAIAIPKTTTSSTRSGDGDSRRLRLYWVG